MSTREAMISEPPLYEVIDGRICPPDQIIEWETPALSTAEVALVNHVHGSVGDFMEGPDEVKVAIGMRTLGELEGFNKASHEATDEESMVRPYLGHESFARAVSTKDRELSEGLATVIDNLRFADRGQEIVPAIVNHYALDFEYPDGVVEDLGSLEQVRAVQRQAVREGVSRNLRLALEIYIDQILTDKRLDGISPKISLGLRDGEEVKGEFQGVHRDSSGDNWYEVKTETGRERVKQGTTVKTLGVAVTRQEAEPEPSRK